MLCFVFVNASVNYRKASIEASFLVILLLKKNVMNSPSLPSLLLQSAMGHL